MIPSKEAVLAEFIEDHPEMGDDTLHTFALGAVLYSKDSNEKLAAYYATGTQEQAVKIVEDKIREIVREAKKERYQYRWFRKWQPSDFSKERRTLYSLDYFRLDADFSTQKERRYNFDDFGFLDIYDNRLVPYPFEIEIGFLEAELNIGQTDEEIRESLADLARARANGYTYAYRYDVTFEFSLGQCEADIVDDGKMVLPRPPIRCKATDVVKTVEY